MAELTQAATRPQGNGGASCARHRRFRVLAHKNPRASSLEAGRDRRKTGVFVKRTLSVAQTA